MPSTTRTILRPTTSLRSGRELEHLPKRIDCGTGDELYASVRDYVSALPGPVEGGFEPGGHDESYWRSVLPDLVSFVGRNFG